MLHIKKNESRSFSEHFIAQTAVAGRGLSSFRATVTVFAQAKNSAQFQPSALPFSPGGRRQVSCQSSVISAFSTLEMGHPALAPSAIF